MVFRVGMFGWQYKQTSETVVIVFPSSQEPAWDVGPHSNQDMGGTSLAIEVSLPGVSASPFHLQIKFPSSWESFNAWGFGLSARSAVSQRSTGRSSVWAPASLRHHEHLSLGDPGWTGA